MKTIFDAVRDQSNIVYIDRVTTMSRQVKKTLKQATDRQN